MPPKKRLKVSHNARNGSVSSEEHGPAPALSTAGAAISLPDSYLEAVEQLVDRVRNAAHDNCAMFKLDISSGGVSELEEGAVAAPSDITAVIPLCEVSAADVPAGAGLYQPRQYAEALQQAVRAHFAFVETDRRMIWTGASVPRTDSAASWTFYMYKYLNSPLQRADAAAAHSLSRGGANRRRTMAVPSASSIEEELDSFKDSLDRAERELLDVSRSHEQELRLPDTPPAQMALPPPSRRSLGTALHTVLPDLAARGDIAARRAAPRAPTHHSAAAAGAQAAAAAGSRTSRKRGRASSREPAGGDDMDITDHGVVFGSTGRAGNTTLYHSITTESTLPSPPAAQTIATAAPHSPTKGGHFSDSEAAQLADFYFGLNGSQSEQARVSLTCRYAKVRYGRDVPAGAIYRLVETSGRRAAASAPPPLSDDEERETALRVFRELSDEQTEQSRVAYTLQYMRVQHGRRITANALFGWLGQGAKTKKAAKGRR